ncbi:MAG: rRNA maturation RNase YbeY [Candidatus Adiutrix sp.]|jgi:probable rRNA maturation factor|nr:rRNA maturation RNase YbeY [Candidatus Adiutrix sp.]
MAIYLSNRQKALPIKRGKLRRRLVRLLKELDLAEADLSLSLVGDQEIREINRQYRGVDKATNVLAFALEEGAPMPGAPRVLGDIVISGETVQREAPPLGYTEAELFYFYLIHGLLHLIGYDHEQGPEEEARQAAETDRLWQLLDHGW